jgi:type I restriction enzyme S subunit
MSFKISEVCDINSFNLSKNDNLNAINYLDTANLNVGTVDELQYMEVGKDKIPSRAKRIVRKNDILISTVRPNQKHYGIIKNVAKNMVASTGFAVLTPKEDKVDPGYIYNYLIQDHITTYLHSIAESSTSTYPSIKPSVIGDLEVDLPPLEEQKAIAHILSTLDDKIEVNNQINKTLENMAQAIFKQWFVDFEFPNEDGEPYKPSGGEMVETELGMIPKGWEVVKLNSVVDICYGKNLPTKKLLSDGYPVFGGNGQIGFYSEYLYEKSQVLIACRGAASGKVIVSLPYSFVTNNSLILEQNGTTVTHEYLKQFCLEKEFYNYATGSAQPQITIANLAKANILIPHRDLMNMFSLIRNSIDSKVLSLFNENNKLVDLRDTLLPKLMSGEIRVPLDEEGEAS